MKTLYQIKSVSCGFAIVDENGNTVPETPAYGDFEWAKIDMIKMAYDYFFAEKEKAEEDCQSMPFNDIEITNDKVVLKGAE